MPTAAAMPVNLADFTFIQYPAREQAELRVRIKIPGSWFNGLSGAERSIKYEAEAYDFVDAHVFKKNGKAQPPCPAIKFLCEDDVFEDPKLSFFSDCALVPVPMPMPAPVLCLRSCPLHGADPR